MPRADEVANALAYDFLRQGLFSQSIGPVEVPFLANAVAAGDGEEVIEQRASEAFGNISVQSVGFEEGPDDPKVHLYLTRGTNKLIKSLQLKLAGLLCGRTKWEI